MKDFTSETFKKIVRKSKKALHEFASSQTKSEREKALNSIGRNEGLATAYCFAMLDADDDGTVTADELKEFREEGHALVERYLSFFNNSSVVAALVLSVVFPLTIENSLEPEWAKNSTSLLATVSPMFMVIGSFSIHVSVAACFLMLLPLGYAYSILSFQLPNLEAKLWFIYKVKNRMSTVEGLKGLSLYCAAVGYIMLNVGTSGQIGFLGAIQLVAIGLGAAQVINMSHRINPFLQSHFKDLYKGGNGSFVSPTAQAQSGRMRSSKSESSGLKIRRMVELSSERGLDIV
uniref:EF-hand domain-containing protein n=1 Tax=Palpitomonas bilix TaxID=652834 RepID=A0A7S3G5I0_9EUKA|mmetsp:Transcript_23489/g.59344  ORF Transcript_23489/g.59344 Transcript_23489/m.59344 type:complete len:290 (+) Transcript_23489:94-963(+)